MEELIYRVVRMISLGVDKADIAELLSPFASQENIFLAFHAAQILYDDYVHAIE